MDKGIKKIQNHVNKIEKSNNHILDKTIANALKLKNTRLSDISYKKITTFEILIHKDTNNFPVVKQKLLSRITDLHIQYPFISLYFDPSPHVQPRKGQSVVNRTLNVHSPMSLNRELRSENENRLILTVNWEDYMRYSLRSIPSKSSDIKVQLPRLGVDERMIEIKKKNWESLQNAINKILLSTPKQIALYDNDKTETVIYLQPNTMVYEITRNHFCMIAQQIMKNYNGIIEIYHNNSTTITIRVHWNIYLSQMAEKEHENRQIPLLTNSSFEHDPRMNKIESNNSTKYDTYISQIPFTTTNGSIGSDKPLSPNDYRGSSGIGSDKLLSHNDHLGTSLPNSNLQREDEESESESEESEESEKSEESEDTREYRHHPRIADERYGKTSSPGTTTDPSTSSTSIQDQLRHSANAAPADRNSLKPVSKKTITLRRSETDVEKARLGTIEYSEDDTSELSEFSGATPESIHSNDEQEKEEEDTIKKARDMPKKKRKKVKRIRDEGRKIKKDLKSKKVKEKRDEQEKEKEKEKETKDDEDEDDSDIVDTKVLPLSNVGATPDNYLQNFPWTERAGDLPPAYPPVSLINLPPMQVPQTTHPNSDANVSTPYPVLDAERERQIAAAPAVPNYLPSIGKKTNRAVMSHWI